MTGYAEAARMLGVTRARLAQIVALVAFTPERVEPFLVQNLG